MLLLLLILHVLFRCGAYIEGRQAFVRALGERGQIVTLKVVCESAPKQLAKFIKYCMDKRRDAL